MPTEAGISPVIIIGMHRSATSLVCTLLEQAGLFLGAVQDPNKESVFFLQLNRWLMHTSSAAWDTPENIQYLLDNGPVRAMTVQYLAHLLGSPRSIAYLGLSGYLRRQTIGRLRIPWGWKDPRNSYTLPLWLDLFPEARVIHVRRHGVDVARSLQVREQQVLEKSIKADQWRRRMKLYYIYPKRDGFVGSLRCQSLDGAFALWETAMGHEAGLVSKLGNRAMSIRCEDLANDNETQRRLLQFAGLSVDDSRLASLHSVIDTRRIYAYRADAALSAFARDHAAALARWGYEAS